MGKPMENHSLSFSSIEKLEYNQEKLEIEVPGCKGCVC